jgi:hypothetical protein
MTTEQSNGGEHNRTDDKPKPEREQADGREVFVTKDESGITALAEDEDAADPRVTTDVGSDNSSDDQEDQSAE